MNTLKLCESDYRFMRVIWDNEPVPSGKLVVLCAEAMGWKKPTTYTALRKLCDKGLVRNVDTVVTSLVPREQVQAFASEYFVDSRFHGSLPGFLTAFLDGKVITEQEAEELKHLIDEHKEG